MPIYEYRCPGCGGRFEKLRRMADAEKPTDCPQCGGETRELLVSCFAAGRCGTGGRGGFT